MPIYEYQCRSCRCQFERLVRAHVLETLACPSCQSEDLERLLSAFAVNSEAGRQKNLEHGRKAAEKGGRDKEIATQEYERGHDH